MVVHSFWSVPKCFWDDPIIRGGAVPLNPMNRIFHSSHSYQPPYIIHIINIISPRKKKHVNPMQISHLIKLQVFQPSNPIPISISCLAWGPSLAYVTRSAKSFPGSPWRFRQARTCSPRARQSRAVCWAMSPKPGVNKLNKLGGFHHWKWGFSMI